MSIEIVLFDKSITAKAKVDAISKILLMDSHGMSEIVDIIDNLKDTDKANCIEAIEFATKQNPKVATLSCLDLVTKSLLSKSPRVKWESAKVIGNIAFLFPKKLDQSIVNLLLNTEFPGTVVRWSAAFALGEIIKLKSPKSIELIPVVDAILLREEKNSIKKIYLKALKEIRS